MAKALKTAALVVGAVALVATGVGAAIGAAAAASTIVAAGVSVATVATVASVAAGVLSLAAGLTAKKPSAADATGSQTSFSADPDAGIPAALGRTGTAGNIVARFGFDTKDAGDNDRQSFVSVLSLGPVAEVDEVLGVDRTPVAFNAAGQALGQFSGFMWRKVQTGLLAGAALTFGTGAGSPPGWTEQHRLSGKAATTWTLRFDTKSKLYQNGVPAPMNVVRGRLVYDPRKDSTYPGGSGPHRMADPADRAAYDAAFATWEWSENPYLHALAFVHGYWQRDMAHPASDWQRVMGMGAPAAGIDLAAFVEGANIADANGWTVGGVIFSGDDKWASLKKILQAGMGEPLALGAKISCLVNAPRVSLATIGIDDVVGDASVGATQPRRDRINTITPRFRLEENNWQLLPGSPITVAEHVVTDRGKRSKTQDYPLIQSTPQVGTAVRYDIENAREFGPIVLPCKLVWMGYKPGDCVSVYLPELGLVGQPILLLNRELDPSAGIVTMTARSETAAKHAYALGQTATPPPTPGVTGAPIAPVPADGVWSITGTSIEANGVTMPALVVTGAVEAGTAQSVTFEYRPFVNGQAPDAGWIAAGTESPDVTRKVITGVASATAYEVAVRYTVRGIVSDRRIVGPVTTAAYEGIRGRDGVSAYAILLTNESHILPANPDGSVITYNGAATEVVVYSAGQDVTASFALSVVSNPQALAVTITGHTATIIGGLDATEPNATLMLRMTGTGEYAGVTLEKQFSLTKSRAGADGSSPALISLSATSQTVRYNTAGTFIDGQAITFTAKRQNNTGATYFTIYAADGRVVDGPYYAEYFVNNIQGDWFAGSAGDTLKISSAGIYNYMASHGGDQGQISVAVWTDGRADVRDQVSLQKVQDGAKGAAGASALAGYLTNESHTFPADAMGNVTNYSGGGGQFRVLLGSTDVTSACSFGIAAASYNGGAFLAPIASDGSYACTALLPPLDSAWVDYQATYNGVTIVRRFSLTKSRAATDGTSPPLLSITASNQLVRYDTAGIVVPGQSITFTATALNFNPSLVAYAIVRVLDGAVLVVGSPSEIVASNPSYYSSTGTDLTLSAQAVRDIIDAHGSFLMRAYTTDLAQNISDQVTIQKVQDGAKGANGTSPIAVYLTNETFTVPTRADGSYDAFPVDVSRGQMKVFDGSTDVTAQCTFTHQDSFNLATTIDAAGNYSATAIYADTAYADMIATYKGKAYSSRLTASKVKGGAKGVDGVNPPLVSVSASPQAIRYDKANTIVSGPVTFTATLVNAIGPVSWSSVVGHAIYNTEGVTVSGNTLTLTAARMALVLAYNEANVGITSETIVASASGVSDRVTVTKVRDGSDGSPGADAITIGSSKVLFGVPTTAAGVPKPGYAGDGGTISVFKGGTPIAPDSYAIAGAVNMASLALNGATYSFAGITADTGYFFIQAVVAGRTYQARIDVQKVKDGSAALGVSSQYNTNAASYSAETSVAFIDSVIPAGATVSVAGSAGYAIEQASSTAGNRSFVGRISLYVQNTTDGGPLMLVDRRDGSTATWLSRGGSEPDVQSNPGIASAAGTFAGAGAPKTFRLSVAVQQNGGTGGQAVSLSGSLNMGVSG